VDAIDGVLDTFRSENPDGKRNRSILVASFVSMLAARTIWKAYVSDVDTGALTFGEPDNWNLADLIWPVAWIPVLALGVWRSHLLAIVGGALIAPLAVAAVAYGLQDERRWQHEARDVFARYTHRFPAGRLHDVDIKTQFQSVIDACAVDGHSAEPVAFCLQMVLDNPKGQQVVGGWRQLLLSGGPGDGAVDCFGEARAEFNC
jgi:hypothetical protein